MRDRHVRESGGRFGSLFGAIGLAAAVSIRSLLRRDRSAPVRTVSAQIHHRRNVTIRRHESVAAVFGARGAMQVSIRARQLFLKPGFRRQAAAAAFRVRLMEADQGV